MFNSADRRRAVRVIQMHDNDNVVVATADIGLGERTGISQLNSRAQVSAGYKIALHAISRGEPIRKYNVIIGFAAQDIVAGDLVHSHNIRVFREICG